VGLAAAHCGGTTDTEEYAMTTPSTWSPMQRMFLTGAAAVVVGAGIREMAPLVNLLLLSLLVTVSMEPLYLWLRRRGVGHGGTVLVTMTGLVVVLAGLIAVLGVGIASLRDRLPFYQERLGVMISDLTAAVRARGVEIPDSGFAGLLSAERIIGLLHGIVGAIGSALSNTFLVLLVVTFLVLDRPRIDASLAGAGGGNVARRRWARLGPDVRTYLSITGALGLVAAALNYVIFFAVDVDGAAIWAVLSFLLSFVPNVGFLLALGAPTLLTLLARGVVGAVAVAAGMIVVNTVVDNVIKPRFMQRGLDLPGSVTILSLLLWSWLLGPLGALLGVPLTVVLRGLLLEEGEADAGASAAEPHVPPEVAPPPGAIAGAPPDG
jgi:predicted PurR-regulated permease PerM